MKIYNNEQILQNLYPETKNKAKQNAGKEFDTILKETVQNTQKTETAPLKTTFMHPLSSVQSIPSFGQEQEVTVERIEKVLDLLDQYRRMLADPNVSLKDLEPVIKEMAQEKERMATAMDSLQDGKGLNNILNQALVTASLEITKFYRGDYIDE